MSSKTAAIINVLLASCLWGFSGIAAQLLFADGFEPGWLVTVRMLLTGSVLTLYGLARGQRAEILRDRGDSVKLLIFAILGMAAVQYTYFASIKFGNAATATFLQYLAPVIVAVYQCIKRPASLKKELVISVAAALAGVFLLVTGGSTQMLQVPAPCLGWGLLSAVALAFYVLYPGSLIKRYGTMNLVGWAMLIGGSAMFLLNSASMFVHPEFSIRSVVLIASVAIFGTLIPFCLFIDSLRQLTATESSLLSCAEPLAAALISAIWLHMGFGAGAWLGAFCIIASVLLLSFEVKTRAPLELEPAVASLSE